MENVCLLCEGKEVRKTKEKFVSRWINVNIYIYMYLFFFQNERNVSNILIVIFFPRTPSITFGPPRFASLHPFSSNLCFLIDEYICNSLSSELIHKTNDEKNGSFFDCLFLLFP